MDTNTTIPRRIIRTALYKDHNWLRRKYIDEGLSMIKIAELAGCSCLTIFKWIRSYGIPIQKSRRWNP
jgi:uncharacterized protein YjcR